MKIREISCVFVRTESSQVSQFGRIIRNGAHEPICSGLPHGVEETAENVEPDARMVYVILEVDEWWDVVSSVVSILY